MQSHQSESHPKVGLKKDSINILSILRTVGLFGALGLEILYTYLAQQTGLWQYKALIINNGALIVATIAIIILAHYKKNYAAAWVIIIAVNITFPLVSIFFSGAGIILAIGIITISPLTALLSLPRSNVWLAIATSILSFIAIILIEFFLDLSDRLQINSLLQNAIIIVMGLVILIYGTYASNEIRLNSMQDRLRIIFILTVTVPALMVGIPLITSSRQNIVSYSDQAIYSAAQQTSIRIESFFHENLSGIQTDARLPAIISYLNGSNPDENVLGILQTYISVNKEIISYALLDINGNNLFDTEPQKNHIDDNEASFPYFQNTISTRNIYISDVFFDPQTGISEFYLSTPVLDENGNILGVLRAEYDSIILQFIIAEQNETIGESSFAILVDENHTILGHGADKSLLYKNTSQLDSKTIAELTLAQRLPPNSQEGLFANIPGIEKGLLNVDNTPYFLLELEKQDITGGDDRAAAVRLGSKPWIVIFTQPGEVFNIPLQEQIRSSLILLLVLIIVALIITNISTNLITKPILQLTAVAERVKAGDLKARSQITLTDEIGTLSTVLNQTIGQLETTLENFEQRIVERTTDLEISRKQSEKRANELQSIGEISKFITSEKNLENLLPLITRLISERFNFYHTGIFLIDNTNQFAVLQASNSTGGKNMLKRGHKLEVGEGGIVGYVAQSGNPRISLDVGKDAVFFNNPDLPNTRSEMALPLKVKNRIIGVLDVQSERPGAFTQNDANTLSILADQVAIALENAQLFEQTHQALSEAQALYRQNLQEGWKTFSREKEFIGYQQSLTSGKKLTEVVETDEIRQSMNRGESLIFHADGVTQEASIVVPIKLRGQIIGNIKINAPTKNRQWSDDEINLAEAISERLSIALENARLIQESQRQVMKEQTISEVTGKIGASINLKNVLQTAVEELGRTIPGSDVLIQFKSDDNRE